MAHNFLYDANMDVMQSALLRAGPIATMMNWGGQRVSLDLPVYLNALNHREFRDNPVYICAAAAFVVPDDALDRSARHIKVVVQTCACGYEEALAATPINTILTRMRDEIRRNFESFDPASLAALRAGREAAIGAPAVQAIPWMVAVPGDGVLDVPPTLEQIHQAIVGFISHPENHYAACIRILAHGILAYCKQGSVTTNVLNKVTTGIRDTLGFTVNLDANTVRDVWNIVSSWMTPARARHFFRIWEGAIGHHCMRLRLVVQQASWAGLTNYTNITKARDTFPDFPWAGLAAIIPEEFNAFAVAIRTIGGDPYFGYSRDLGLARATLYPNLAYAAYQLLREIGGDQDLREFQGVNRRVANAALIDTMITEYRNQRTANARANIANPGPRFVGLAENFIGAVPAAPANPGGALAGNNPQA